MKRVVLKSKIHRATVTRADVDYEGSLGIGPELMQAADIVAGEQVHVVNISNGSRAVTYAITGEAGEISLNGGMAQVGNPGDLVIVTAYANADDSELIDFKPRVVHVDSSNRIVRDMPASAEDLTAGMMRKAAVN